MLMERELLYLKIYNDLLEGIQSGTWPQGSRLPSEKELAEQYEVSRITCKKALEMLVAQNRIVRMPGKGSYVLDAEKAADKAEAVLEVRRNGSPDTAQKLIGLVIDQLEGDYGNQIVSGVEHECRQRNFNMILKCTYGNEEEETKALEALMEMKVQGVILMCAQGENYNAAVLKLFVGNFPIILVDREMPGLPIPCVSTDNYSAAKELTDALISRGHKNTCFLSHHYSPNLAVAARFSGYLDSVLGHGLTTGEEFWIKDLNSRLPRFGDDEGEEKADMERIRSFVLKYPQVTGFFAVNLPVAAMVYRVLKERGEEHQKEIVCFDGYEEGNYTNFGFTHITQGGFLIGAKAVKYLQDRMEGKEVARKKYIPYTLVKRVE